MKRIALLFFIVLLSVPVMNAQERKITINPPQSEITAKEIHQIIAYMADDNKKGRFPGTPESKEVANFIRNEFKSYGLKPLGDDYFQYFTISVGVRPVGENYLKVKDKEYAFEKDYLPMGFSGKGNFSSDKVVFVGYGFDIDKDSLKWNDYENVDVKGKWVVVYRGFPNDDKYGLNFFKDQKSEISKALLAKDKGAVGVLFVNPPQEKDKFIPFVLPRVPADAHIAVLQIKRDLAEKILGKKLVKIEKKRQKNPHYTFEVNTPVSAAVNYEIVKVKTQNVVGVLESNDPKWKDRYVVIGAHYDHLGMGGYESGSRMPDTIAIHNGADDNASGVAGVLELAEYLASVRDTLKRSIIFVAFGAEERGLLGSKYFVEHPLVPRDHIDFMLNMDMIGLYKNSLSAMGVGTSKAFKDIFASVKYDTNAIKVRPVDKAFGGSDHASFQDEKIPAVFFYASSAEHYHTPFDDIQYIKADKEADILKYIASIAIASSRYNGIPVFIAQKDESKKGYSKGGKVRLGIRPAFGDMDIKGVMVDGVTENGPADKAGLQKGDIIVEIAGEPIENIYDYMAKLSKHKQGETIEVKVLRHKKPVVFKVKL